MGACHNGTAGYPNHSDPAFDLNIDSEHDGYSDAGGEVAWKCLVKHNRARFRELVYASEYK